MATADARQPGGDPRFTHLLATEIRPRIPALEDRRHALAGAVWRDAVLLSIAAAVAAAHVGVRGAEELVSLIVLGAIVAGAWLHARRRRIWQAAMIEAVMPAICRFLGVTRYRPAGEPHALLEFEARGLVKPCGHRTVAHQFEARRGDMFFTAQHAALRRARLRPGWAPHVFHGLLMRVWVRVRPPTCILVVPADDTRANVLRAPQTPPSPSFERLHLGDPRFEELFHVLTAPLDRLEAERVREYLAPNLREALLAIEAQEARGGHGRASPRAAFDGDSFYLALPRVDWLGVGPFRIGRARPFLDPGGVLFLGDLEETVRVMAHDAAAPNRIVEHLVGG